MMLGIIAAALLVSNVVASQIAYWQYPSGQIIRDTLFISGGIIAKSNWTNGTTPKWNPSPTIVNQPNGYLWNISLHDAYDGTTDDPNNLLRYMSGLTSDGRINRYVAGGMFADYSELYTYGGTAYPVANNLTFQGVTYVSAFPPNAAAVGWVPSMSVSEPLNNNVNIWVAAGGYASAPSEKLGFYFSGLRSPTNGTLDAISQGVGAYDDASTPARSMVRVDMSKAGKASWNLTALPPNIKPRAESGLVWIPLGQKGILIAIGGVVTPIDLAQDSNSNTTTSDFLTSLPVYDIAGDRWYVQNATTPQRGFPGQLAGFCTSVATSQDNSTFVVYVYGGYDGTYDSNPQAFDAVWALHIPTFQWIKVSNGTDAHRRQSHFCVTPNPTTMMSFGGVIEYGSPLLSPKFIDYFDMNNLIWTSRYDPRSTAQYEVPEVIISAVGGTKTGGVPVPSTVVNGLNTILGRQYNGTISGFSPYSTNSPTPSVVPISPSPTASPSTSASPSPTRNGLATWKIALIVVLSVLGAALLGCLAFYFCYWRNRDSEERRRRKAIMSWGKGVKSDPSETTAVETAERKSDYFGITSNVAEMPSALASSTPTANYSPGYMSPRVPLSSNPMLSPSEVEGAHHPSMSTNTAAEITSIREHPLYPPRLGATGVSTTSSIPDTMTQQGTQSVGERPALGHHTQSQEMSARTNSGNLTNAAVTAGNDHHSAVSGTDPQLDSPPGSPPSRPDSEVRRKPIAAVSHGAEPVSPNQGSGTGHQHNHSLGSSHPTLSQPDSETGERMSRYIAGLPDNDHKTPRNDLRPQTPPDSHAGGRETMYKENFDGPSYSEVRNTQKS